MKKTLRVALVLFVAWNIVAIFLPPPPSDAPNLWNRNLITAERLLYDVESLDDTTVVLGSSHAAGLVFPESVFNLSLAGLSIYDGDLVLAMRRDTPRTVWIEANVIHRPPNPAFARRFSAASNVKQFLPGLRTCNQPIAIMHRCYDWVRPRLKAALLDRPLAMAVPRGQEDQPPPAALIDAKRWESPVDKNDLIDAITRLRELVDRLRKNDVEVAFFEMPQHPEICKSAHVRSIRQAIKTAFADIPYLDHSSCDDYQTSDGLHLTSRSAQRYSRYLREQMAEVNPR